MPSSEVSLALFVPLVAKDDTIVEVSQFLGAGYDLVQAEKETIQWFGVKYEDQATYAIFDTFKSESGRSAHLNGKVAEALMANAPALLADGPEIAKPKILANKVVAGDKSKTAGLTVGLRVFLTPKPEKVDEVREFLKSAVPLVEAEEQTPVWYALEFPDATNTFAIIDFFADENGRGAHLGGKVAEALFAKADELLATAPEVIKFTVVAANVNL